MLCLQAGSRLAKVAGIGDVTAVISLVVCGLVVMSFICEKLLSGAGFNPAVSISFVAAGKAGLLETIPRMVRLDVMRASLSARVPFRH